LLFPDYQHEFKDSGEVSLFSIETFLKNYFDEIEEGTPFCNNNRYFYGDAFTRDELDVYNSGICEYSPIYRDDILDMVTTLIDDIIELDEDLKLGKVIEIENYKYLIDLDQSALQITYQSPLYLQHFTFGEIEGKKHFSSIKKLFSDQYEWISFLEDEYILYDKLDAFERTYFHQDYKNDEFTYYQVAVPSSSNDYYLLELAYKKDNYINEVRYMADDLNDEITLDSEIISVLISDTETSFSFSHNYNSDEVFQDYDKIILNALQLNNWDEIIELASDDGSVWKYNMYLSDQLAYSDYYVTFAPHYDYPEIQVVVSSMDEDVIIVSDEYVIPAELLHQLESKIDAFNSEHENLMRDLRLSTEEIILGETLDDYLLYLNEYLEFTLDKIKF
jgi:hypothetical protein